MPGTVIARAATGKGTDRRCRRELAVLASNRACSPHRTDHGTSDAGEGKSSASGIAQFSGKGSASPNTGSPTQHQTRHPQISPACSCSPEDCFKIVLHDRARHAQRSTNDNRHQARSAGAGCGRWRRASGHHPVATANERSTAWIGSIAGPVARSASSRLTSSRRNATSDTRTRFAFAAFAIEAIGCEPAMLMPRAKVSHTCHPTATFESHRQKLFVVASQAFYGIDASLNSFGR